MKFESANPSVVRSIKQRDLLNTWLRALRKPHPLPVISNFRPERITDELAEMMGYDVEGEGEAARFVITQEGARLATTYGNDHKDVSYERLLLPFGKAGKVEQIVGSFKAISIESGFKVNNGIQPKTLPVSVVNAVIDREIARRPLGTGAADDIVELSDHALALPPRGFTSLA
jgi:hypothetical protein